MRLHGTASKVWAHLQDSEEATSSDKDPGGEGHWKSTADSGPDSRSALLSKESIVPQRSQAVHDQPTSDSSVKGTLFFTPFLCKLCVDHLSKAQRFPRSVRRTCVQHVSIKQRSQAVHDQPTSDSSVKRTILFTPVSVSFLGTTSCLPTVPGKVCTVTYRLSHHRTHTQLCQRYILFNICLAMHQCL